jgi:alpha-glucan,water dikinase
MGSEDLLRQMLSFIGRGAVNGQEVRDGILNIMHKHHISEDRSHFYEQWHQKLHNNTTPDDIVICEAVLHFLRSNDVKKYWDTLNKGGITKERLESFERKIVSEPFHAPQLIHDFEWYLKLLKKVHASIDLNLTIEASYGKLNSDMKGQIKAIQDNIVHAKDNIGKILDQMGRVTKFRIALHKTYATSNDMDTYRELMFLDIALDYYVRQLVEKIIHLKLDTNSLFKEIEFLLDNLALSYDWLELDVCKKEFSAVKDQVLKCDKDYTAALRVKSIVDRIKRFLGEVIDHSFKLIQPRAIELGTKCDCDPMFVNIFTEDVIRGSLFFAVSMVIKKFEPILRKTLGTQSWLVISSVKEVTGKVLFVKDLHSIDHENYKENMIILTELVEGDEEVPSGVTALILLNDNDYPDVLAHVSVRARNGRVLFLVCLEPEGDQANQLKKLADKYARLILPGNGLNIKEISADEAKKVKSNKEDSKNSPKLKMPEDKIDKYIILPEEYTYLRAGGKSNNLNKIRGKVEEWINLPECITMQFNSAEDIIASSENSKVQSNLNVTLYSNN